MAENTVKKQRNGEAEPPTTLWYDPASRHYWRRDRKIRGVTRNLPQGGKIMGQAIFVLGDDAEVLETMINAPTEEQAARIQAKIFKFINPSEPETKEE
ncbi:hypothetical protein [Desulfurivibrio sp. C05AmB]|uniref:hypothetical protein n=1 Tax=Desulfurivibrio sp. C05AmB TaxID=3374371 RepID=UPI00376EC644